MENPKIGGTKTLKYSGYLELKQEVLDDQVTTNFLRDFLEIPSIVARCLIKDWKEQQEKIIDLELENAKLKEALKFYANKENYEEWNEDLGLTEYIHAIDFDGGDTARKALENSQSEK